MNAVGNGCNRPPIQQWRQPLLIITGDADPLCDVQALKKLIAPVDPPPELVIVPGNHVLEAGSREETKASAQRAIESLTAWLQSQAKR